MSVDARREATDISAPSIRPAAEEEAAALSAAAMRSKAYWNYAPELLESWRGELTVTSDDLRRLVAFVATVDGAIAGWYGLERSETAWSLEYFWVLPEFMGRGIGRALLAHACSTAYRAGAEEILVDADPNAEAFYVRCGAVRIGQYAYPIPGEPERIRPLLRLRRAAIS